MKLLIFDLDGTLLDTLSDIATSCNYALSKNSYPTHAIEDYKKFIGHGVRKLSENALPANSNQSEVDKILYDFKSHYEIHSRDTTKPYDGIVELLNQLKATQYLISVASNKYHEAVVEITQYYFPTISFDLVLGSKENVPAKPNPSIVMNTLQSLDINKEDCIFIGDSSVDMQTAKNADVKSIGVTWGFRSEQELIENGANYIVHQPQDILKLLHIINPSKTFC